ncbi:hypothetical protein TsFJ059_002386 [Trichoderma semiorbis]|uniref:Small EDRK-rich factor-like N-terminal domain-containing protein n=1 Tax=Trichoderma semiorbis TaxID=1491008 RepID=A0A9P8HM68_9HYPO|nr:hypothetical protein TsFJ059_002386 [Trichoderma semiorbis]
MARGNQRDLAREKNQKNAAKNKGGNKKDGYEQAKDKLSDAEKMRQKQLEANKKKEEAAAKAAQEKMDAKAKKPTQLGA